MDVVTGAMGNLAPKLLQLLRDEHNLPKEVKKQVESISDEMKFIKAALEELGKHPPDQLDSQDRIWAGKVRESLYDMEDVADTFLVRVEGGDEPANHGRLKHAMEKMGQLFSKGKARHNIASIIQDIKKRLQEVNDMRAKYQVVAAKPAAAARIDPRLGAIYQNASNLVGIEEPRDALIEMLLSVGEDVTSSKELQKVWVVGFGGLGKTTLAKAAYDKVKLKFDCCAFVQVGRTPVPKKVLKNILVGLIKDERGRNSIGHHDKEMYTGADLMGLEAEDLIRHLREFLQGKRYFIVVDDIWDTSTWDVIKHAFVDCNLGSRIVMTGRNAQISAKVGGKVYRINKLSDDNSRKLFGARISGKEGDKCPDMDDEISDQILQKCAGVPLAIIAVASSLATKPSREWHIVYKSIGFEPEGNSEFDNMMKILSFSYYDLPSHLRTCMLYLSVFPEDHFVDKNSLIWRWIAEGLVPVEKGKEPFQVGESYFHELINRGLILAVEYRGILIGCRVHYFVLGLIRKLSSEENFVVVPDSEQRSVSLPEDPKVRRLALQNILDTKNSWSGDIRRRMAAARSFNAMDTNLVPPVDGCKVLRVLSLDYCSTGRGYLKHVGKRLPHLRYLGLTSTLIKQLPVNLGNLKFLQALMLEGTGIEELPESLGQLTQLMCLRCDKKTRVPDWIGNLTSLVELQMYPGAAGKCFAKELGKLTKLRVLRTEICVQDEGEAIELLRSLSKLKEIEIMEVRTLEESFVLTEGAMQPGLVLGSRNLRVLFLEALRFPRMPEWVNVEAFPDLCQLSLDLAKVGVQEDVKTVARFQQLQLLGLLANLWSVPKNVDLADVKFHNLVEFASSIWAQQKLLFQILGAMMPRLEHIYIPIQVLIAKLENQDFEILGTLCSLQRVTALLHCGGSFPAEVEEVVAAIRHQVGIHPNRPTLQVVRTGDEEGTMASTNSGQLLRLGEQVRLAWERLKGTVQEIGEVAQASAACNIYFYATIHPKVRRFRYHCFDTAERAVHGRILWRHSSDEDCCEDAGLLFVQRFDESLRQYLISLARFQPDRDVRQVTENIAVLEQVLERLTVEIPRLDVMWEQLKAELSQQTPGGAGTDKIATQGVRIPLLLWLLWAVAAAYLCQFLAAK